MRKDKIYRISFLVGLFLITLPLFFWLFDFTNFIHETGHMVFGFLDGLIKGNINQYQIGAWTHDVVTPIIPLPQQTKIVKGQGSANFALGGPIFDMLIFACLSFLGFSRTKKKYWFLLFLFVAIFESSGNIVCGTDNLMGNPLLICNQGINLYVLLSARLAFALFFALISTIELEKRIVKKPTNVGRTW